MKFPNPSGRRGGTAPRRRLPGRAAFTTTTVTVLTALATAAACCAALAGCSADAVELAGLGVGPLRTTWDVGSCHRLDQPEETDPVFLSDTSPAVPCTAPHQSETFAVEQLTGAVAAAKERPGPETLQQALRGVCSWQEMGDWLGEQTPDIIRDISVAQYVPSVAEWRAGVRTVRCDAVIGPRTTAAAPTISRSLRGIVRTADAVRFRVCRLGYVEVTCDQLHDGELAYPYVKFTDAELRANDRTAMLAKVEKACGGIVTAYLGEPLSRLHGYTLSPELPKNEFHPDSRVGHCWISPSGAMPTVLGTVRRAGGAA